jgi:hypothetical protein
MCICCLCFSFFLSFPFLSRLLHISTTPLILCLYACFLLSLFFYTYLHYSFSITFFPFSLLSLFLSSLCFSISLCLSLTSLSYSSLSPVLFLSVCSPLSSLSLSALLSGFSVYLHRSFFHLLFLYTLLSLSLFVCVCVSVCLSVCLSVSLSLLIYQSQYLTHARLQVLPTPNNQTKVKIPRKLTHPTQTREL